MRIEQYYIEKEDLFITFVPLTDNHVFMVVDGVGSNLISEKISLEDYDLVIQQVINKDGELVKDGFRVV